MRSERGFGAHFAVSIYKVWLLITNKSVYWFAVAYSIEYGIIGLSLLVIYRKQGTQKLQFCTSLIKPLLTKSYPYIWAAMMVTVFQNTDHIMLTTMIGKTENGFYSAAITTTAVAQFVYTAIIDSFRPLILQYYLRLLPMHHVNLGLY